MLPLQGAWLRSLVRKLRSCKPLSTGKKKKMDFFCQRECGGYSDFGAQRDGLSLLWLHVDPQGFSGHSLPPFPGSTLPLEFSLGWLMHLDVYSGPACFWPCHHWAFCFLKLWHSWDTEVSNSMEFGAIHISLILTSSLRAIRVSVATPAIRRQQMEGSRQLGR